MALGPDGRRCWKYLSNFMMQENLKIPGRFVILLPREENLDFNTKKTTALMYFYLEIKFNLIMVLYSGTK